MRLTESSSLHLYLLDLMLGTFPFLEPSSRVTIFLIVLCQVRMEYKKWFHRLRKEVESESTEVSHSTTHTKMVSSTSLQEGFI